MKHLAIFNDKETIEKILNGEKTMEGRFSRDKDIPYDKIKKGDEIFLKEAGGCIKGRAEADNVLFYNDLTPEKIAILRKEYNHELSVGDDFWKKYGKSKYVALIFLTNPQRFISPIKYRKKDRRGWAIIKEVK